MPFKLYEDSETGLIEAEEIDNPVDTFDLGPDLGYVVEIHPSEAQCYDDVMGFRELLRSV